LEANQRSCRREGKHIEKEQRASQGIYNGQETSPVEAHTDHRAKSSEVVTEEMVGNEPELDTRNGLIYETSMGRRHHEWIYLLAEDCGQIRRDNSREKTAVCLRDIYLP